MAFFLTWTSYIISSKKTAALSFSFQGKHIISIMKFSTFATLACLASSANALAPSGRRAFLSKVATTAASVAVASPAIAADYNLDFDESIVVKKESKEDKGTGGNGGLIVGGALAGGLALSLPFFAPNLARMAGIKNAKTPK